jgi:hypothetical protein
MGKETSWFLASQDKTRRPRDLMVEVILLGVRAYDMQIETLRQLGMD